MRPTADPVWTAFAAMILILLSISYIPGANQPYRYRYNAWMAVLARPPGVFFFLILNPGVYPTFGLLDLVLFRLLGPRTWFLRGGRLGADVKQRLHQPTIGSSLDLGFRGGNVK
jgi:hypothetical protein